MRMLPHSHPCRRPALAPLAVLPPAALIAAAIIPALGARPSHAAPAPAMRQITIRASAPKFPKQIPAGFVSVTLVSDARGEADAGFARLNPGATLAQVKAVNAQAQNSLPAFVKLSKLLTFIGGAGSIPTGSTETVVLDMRKPGTYGFNLSVGNGNSSGKTTIFTVTSGSAQGAAPSGGIPVRLKEMKIVGMPKQAAAGPVTLQVANTGKQVHELSLVKLDPGKTQKDVVALLKSPQGQNGPPPSWAHDMGGLDTISPHQSASLQLTLTPGYYVAICFMPDVKKQGTPHVMEGMITHFTVQ